MSLDIRYFEPQPNCQRRIAGSLLAVVIVVYLVVTLFLGNLAQFASLVIYPFSPPLFRKVNRFLAGWFWGHCHHVAKLTRTEMVIHESSAIPDEENAIVVANHQGAVDIAALFPLACSKKMLGDIKWFVKEMFRYVPGMGHGMMFVGTIFLKRNWTKDRARIERTFRHTAHAGVPFWVTMFAEGTRLKGYKQEKSDQMAARYHRPPFQHVLFPATKGFIAATQHLRSRLDAVYDVTIHFPDGIPTLWSYACGLVRRIDIYVSRHPIATLPASDAELAAWLVQRYAEKEQLLGNLKSTVK